MPQQRKQTAWLEKVPLGRPALAGLVVLLLVGSADRAQARSAATPRTPPRLSTPQRQLLDRASRSANASSRRSRGQLRRKVQALGFSLADLRLAEAFFSRKAPLAIAFDAHPRDSSVNLLDAWLADPIYRNQFETGVSGGQRGTIRLGIEDRLFRNGFSRLRIADGDRPKYAAVNAVNLPLNDQAYSYGPFHFVMKPSVRSRATLTYRDSSECRAGDIATFSSFSHLLNRLDAAHLAEIIRVAKGKRQPVDVAANDQTRRAAFCNYIEAQIHGSIDLRRDVKEIVGPLHLRDTANGRKVRRIGRQYAIPVRWVTAFE